MRVPLKEDKESSGRRGQSTSLTAWCSLADWRNRGRRPLCAADGFSKTRLPCYRRFGRWRWMCGMPAAWFRDQRQWRRPCGCTQNEEKLAKILIKVRLVCSLCSLPTLDHSWVEHAIVWALLAFVPLGYTFWQSRISHKNLCHGNCGAWLDKPYHTCFDCWSADVLCNLALLRRDLDYSFPPQRALAVEHSSMNRYTP